jgi:antirestriction protein ArdC
MPPFSAFRDPVAYYSTLAHEIGNAASVLVIGVVIAIIGRVGRYESASIWGWLIR